MGRNGRLLLLARFCSGMGNYVGPLAITFALLNQRQSVVVIGLVLAMRGVTAPIGSLVGGIAADRWGGRVTLILSDTWRLVGHGALAAGLLMGSAGLPAFVVAELVWGLGWGAASPATGALTVSVLPRQLLQQFNGRRGVVYGLAMVAGPVLGGLVVALASPAAALLADAGLYLVAIVLVAVVREGARVMSSSPSSSRRDAWMAVRDLPEIWNLGLIFVIYNFAYAGFYLLGPVIAKADLGGPGAWGEIAGAIGVGALVGSAAAAKFAPRQPAQAILITGGLWALPLLSLAVSANLALTIGAAALAGIGFGYFNPAWHTMLQTAISRDVLGKVLGLDGLVSGITMPVGYVLVGVLAAASSNHVALLGLAAIWLLCVSGGVIWVGGMSSQNRQRLL